MPAWDSQQTICAIASGAVGALRGIVRISGPDALTISNRLVENHCDFTQLKRATRVPNSILLTAIETVLKADFYVWPNHRSYTGQPSVEIHTHGNQVLLQLLVEQIVACGAITAQPGEFTYRAFLSGRLDLPQCEAVLGVIHCQSDAALQVALNQLAGGLSQPLNQVRIKLINLLADLEAGLDFVEEDIQFVSPEIFQQTLDEIDELLKQVSGQLGTRRRVEHRPSVVLVGLPNAGKSSLTNALSRQQAAIVSSTAGTTRDFVRTKLTLDSVELDLIDTAGFEQVLETVVESLDNKLLHPSRAELDISAEAQNLMRLQWRQADLVLFCFDASEENIAAQQVMAALQTQIAIGQADQPEIWLVRTKSDMNSTSTASELPQCRGSSLWNREFATSSLQSTGLDDLRCQLANWAKEKTGTDQSDVVPMTLVRCSTSVVAAIEAIERARLSIGDEVAAAELRIALDELGQVVGEVYTDDILDALFSRFCIGK